MGNTFVYRAFRPRTIVFQCGANGIEQILVAERLSKEFDCTCCHSANAH